MANKDPDEYSPKISILWLLFEKVKLTYLVTLVISST